MILSFYYIARNILHIHIPCTFIMSIRCFKNFIYVCGIYIVSNIENVGLNIIPYNYAADDSNCLLFCMGSLKDKGRLRSK